MRACSLGSCLECISRGRARQSRPACFELALAAIFEFLSRLSPPSIVGESHQITARAPPDKLADGTHSPNVHNCQPVRSHHLRRGSVRTPLHKILTAEDRHCIHHTPAPSPSAPHDLHVCKLRCSTHSTTHSHPRMRAAASAPPCLRSPRNSRIKHARGRKPTRPQVEQL